MKRRGATSSRARRKAARKRAREQPIALAPATDQEALTPDAEPGALTPDAEPDVPPAEDVTAVPAPRPSRSSMRRSLRFPLEHPAALAILAIAVASIRLADAGFWPTAILSRLLLVSFGFGALVRVAVDEPGFVLPSLRDVRLASAALVLAHLPLLIGFAFVTGVPEILSADVPPSLAVAHAQEEAPEVIGPGPAESADPHAGGFTLLVVGIALAWKFAVLPSALVVAATSGSVAETLNPLAALPVVGGLGPRYWKSARFYAVVVLLQAVLGLGLDLTAGPRVAAVLKSAVDAYGWLAVGCALGLAISRHRRRSPRQLEDDHAASLDDRAAGDEPGM